MVRPVKPRFHALGVTEKELGGNFKERMINIARIRKALNGVGLENMPIHIFGSLDTVSTPLYFVAGADIFDGLTWLRFAYYKGMTIYRQNYARSSLSATSHWSPVSIPKRMFRPLTSCHGSLSEKMFAIGTKRPCAVHCSVPFPWQLSR